MKWILTNDGKLVLMKALPGKGFEKIVGNTLVTWASINCNWSPECKLIFLKIATDCNFFFDSSCFYL